MQCKFRVNTLIMQFRTFFWQFLFVSLCISSLVRYKPLMIRRVIYFKTTEWDKCLNSIEPDWSNMMVLYRIVLILSLDFKRGRKRRSLILAFFFCFWCEGSPSKTFTFNNLNKKCLISYFATCWSTPVFFFEYQKQICLTKAA